MIFGLKVSRKAGMLTVVSAALALFSSAQVLAADDVGRRIEMSMIEKASGFSGGDIPAEQMPAPPFEFKEIEFGTGGKTFKAETACLESVERGFSMPADLKNFNLEYSRRDRLRKAAVTRIKEMAKLSRGILPEKYNETMEKISKLEASVNALSGTAVNDLRAVAALLSADASSAAFIDRLCSGSKQARMYLNLVEGYPVEPATGKAARANIEMVREIAGSRLEKIAANDSVRRKLIEKNNNAAEEVREKLKAAMESTSASRGGDAVASFNLSVAAFHEQLLELMRLNYFQLMQIGDVESAHKIFDCRIVNGKCEFIGGFMDEYNGLADILDFRYRKRDGFGGVRVRTMKVEQFKYKRAFDSMFGTYCREEMRMNEALPMNERTEASGRVSSCVRLSGARKIFQEEPAAENNASGMAAEY